MNFKSLFFSSVHKVFPREFRISDAGFLFIWWSLCLFVLTVPSATAEGTINSLVEKWDKQRAEVPESFEVKFRVNQRRPSHDISEAELRNLWSRYDLRHSQQFNQFAKELDRTIGKEQPAFSEVKLIVDINAYREERVYDGITHTTIQRDDSFLLIDSRNNQVSVLRRDDRPPLRILNASEFRYIPLGSWFSDARVSGHLDNGRLAIGSADGAMQLNVDLDSGFVYESTRYATVSGVDRIMIDLQMHPFRVAGTDVYPRILARFEFANDILESYFVWVVDSFKLVKKHKKDAFSANVGPGINVFDFRNSRSDPNFRTTDRRYPDLMLSIETGDFFK
jgi:hypothetical protein